VSRTPGKRTFLPLLLTFALGAFSAAVSFADPGKPDGSFGRHGIVRLDVDPSSSNVSDEIEIDANGRIVVLTRSADDQSKLLRLTPSGSRDRSFGEGDGSVSMPGGPWTALAIQPDGRILVAGAREGTFFIARYDRSGRLDPGFGAGSGTVTRTVDPGLPTGEERQLHAEMTALALEPGGRIVALGYLSVGGRANRRDVLMRFHEDGTGDASFGENSVVFLNPVPPLGPPRLFHFSSLTVEESGKVLVGGSIDRRLVVLRLMDGRLDHSWGGDGIVASGLETQIVDSGIGGHIGEARAVLIQSSGRIVAVGKLTVLGLQPSGDVDTSFGSQGKTHGGLSSFMYPEVADGALDSKDRVLVTGGTRDRTVIVRFLADGRLDPRFGCGGIAVVNASTVKAKAENVNAHEASTAIAVAGGDRPITAGFAFVNRRHAVLALTKRLGGNGKPHCPRPRLP
jgi:uncharacterized delta-60 repeat protein